MDILIRCGLYNDDVTNKYSVVELSEVLWNMVMQSGLATVKGTGGAFFAFVVFW